MIEQVIREFPITVYGNLTKYSDTISKGRFFIYLEEFCFLERFLFTTYDH